jgi:hypothetical protein
MMGRISRLEDFEKYGSIDVMRTFENKSIGAYHNFLKKYDDEYSVELITTQEEMLAFVSQKVVNGKRIHELQVLKRLLKYQRGIMKLVSSDLEKTYGKQFIIDAQDNVARVLTNNFVTNLAGKKKFSKSIFLEKDGEDYNVSSTFEEAIQDEDRFLSPSRLIAHSKQSRTAESKDIQHIYSVKENETKIYLFVRKNKDDNISKEFYFFGEIDSIREDLHEYLVE